MAGIAHLVTCEHGGNRIPGAYRALFRGQARVLASHRGYDPGALSLARLVARRLQAPLVSATVSRLLVDLNRSIGHPELFSEWSRRASSQARERIIAAFYAPFRHRAEELVARFVAQDKCVLHVSVHTFTPRLAGVVRTADLGFLYDPARPQEAAQSARWQADLRARLPGLRVRRNYPYRGAADGFTAHLRRRWPAGSYVGIELEINQAIVHAGGQPWRTLRAALADILTSPTATGESPCRSA
jgi:predicted N-formylglutamate amidohydrolase